MKTILKWLLLLFGLPALSALAVGAWLINERVKEANQMPDYEPWHTKEVAEVKAQEYAGFESFAELEQREQQLFTDVYDPICEHARGKLFCRYNLDSLSSPAAYVDLKAEGVKGGKDADENCNGSFELCPESPQGGVLLIHGLSDSPYHMWALAKVFVSKGYYVLGLRLPAHGTYPNALASVHRRDWSAAVDCGVRLVRNEIGADKPVYLGGFSTGCALALQYTLKSVDRDDPAAIPEKLFFFSPLVGVANQAAVFSNLHSWISWTDYASKLKWIEIKPEFDPCRYSSFPKNAGYQVYKLTQENKRLIGKLSDAQRLRMPDLFCFASVADATVKVEDIVWLFSELGNEKSELVLFDVNHFPTGDAITASDDQNDNQSIEGQERQGSDLFGESDYLTGLLGTFDDDGSAVDMNSTITWVTNRGAAMEAVTAYSWLPGSKSYAKLKGADPRSEIEQQWPHNVFALSHICIPIAPVDTFYGETSILHNLKPRGERSVLALSMDDVTRLKFNPFFDYMKGELEEMIDVD